MSASYLNWNSEVSSPAIIWEGEGVNEIGRRVDTNEVVIKIDPRYFRPTEVEQLIGDAKKAQQQLGWSPDTDLKSIIQEMIDYDRTDAIRELRVQTKKKSNQ